MNFTLYFVAVGRRSLKPLYRSPELRFFLLILAIVVAIVCIELYRSGMYGVKDAFVHGFFLTSSMMTDNGTAIADYTRIRPIPSCCCWRRVSSAAASAPPAAALKHCVF